MKHLIAERASLVLSAIWLSVFLLTHVTDVASVLCGKGIRIISNEYYRFFTAGLVHTNLVHTLGNIYLILWLGNKYENSIGSFRFLCIGFVGSALSYFIFSLIYKNAISSAGGSGYWYALAGYILAQQFLVSGFTKSGQKWLILYVLVFLSISPITPGMAKGAAIFHVIAFVLGVCMGIMPIGVN